MISSEPSDSNGDGVVDAVFVDVDDDGLADLLVADTDFDGIADEVLTSEAEISAASDGAAAVDGEIGHTEFFGDGGNSITTLDDGSFIASGTLPDGSSFSFG